MTESTARVAAAGGYPTELSDRVLHAWSRAGFGAMQVVLELAYDRPIDAGRLAVAFERLREHEPLVGCRFAEDERGGPPWWEPVVRYRPLTVTDEAEAYERFRATLIRAGEEAQVKACLEQSGSGARLCIVMAHELADAGGMKDLAALLARCYADPEGPPPEPSRGSRSMRQVLGRFTARELCGAGLDGLAMLARTCLPRATAGVRQTGAAAEGFQWIVERIESDAGTALAAYGRRRGATLNDLVTAAYLAAMGRMSPVRPGARLRVLTTVDLRRYLPGRRAGRPCNLSGFEVLTLPCGAGSTFESVLAGVVGETRARKRRLIGLAGMASSPMLEGLGQRRLDALFQVLFEGWRRSGNLAPSLTNMGPLDGRALALDGRLPSSAWLIVPAHTPPHVGVGVSGYRGGLTLTAAATPRFAPTMRLLFRSMAGMLADAVAGEGRARRFA